MAEHNIIPIEVEKVDTSAPLEVYYTGPSLTEGPLPAFFYFALSAQESLTLDPFNQPVRFLKGKPLRVFSITLPGHGEGYDNKHAMGFWFEQAKNDGAFFKRYVKNVVSAIDELIGTGILIQRKIGIGGLSRGGFIAARAAALSDNIPFVLGFAPLTRLSALQEFSGMDLSDMDLIHLAPQLCEKKVRLYIGNRDQRVGTANCFEFASEITERAFHQGIRSPAVELYINPSVGFKGHGTLPYVFKEGAEWMAKHLIS